MLIAVITRPATASPRTNLLAPSMAPKNSISCSSAARRARAPRSSIMPAARSASMAICLPGNASNVNRAATSAMRFDPLVMTVKFTTRRIRNTTPPTIKLPPTANFPNVSITCPAAPVPSPPLSRISRVVATFRPNLNKVVISNSDGNTEKSSGRSSDNPTSRINTETPMFSASNMSRTSGGSGRIRIARTLSTAPANSPWASPLSTGAPGPSGAPVICAAIRPWPPLRRCVP